jgi:hypothetical protein
MSSKAKTEISKSNVLLVRHYATSRKIAGLRPDDVNEFFFNLLNPSSRTTPWFTQPNINEYQKQKNNVYGE